jgi:hypothetical protein
MQRRSLINLLGAGGTLALLPLMATAHPTWQGLQDARRHLRPLARYEVPSLERSVVNANGQSREAAVVREDMSRRRLASDGSAVTAEQPAPNEHR